MALRESYFAAFVQITDHIPQELIEQFDGVYLADEPLNLPGGSRPAPITTMRFRVMLLLLFAVAEKLLHGCVVLAGDSLAQDDIA